MSMEGWWMVHTMVLPVLTILRTVLITIAAALASSPEKDTSSSLPNQQHDTSIPARRAVQSRGLHASTTSLLQFLWCSVAKCR